MSVIDLLYQQKDCNLIYSALPRILESGYCFGPHSHKDLEICLIQKGECDIIINGEAVTIHEGEVMIIFSHMVHIFHVAGSRSVHFLQVCFHFKGPFHVSPETARGLKFISYMMDPTSSYLLYPSTPEMHSCVERICQEYARESSEHRVSLANLYISEMVFRISEELNQDYRRVFMHITNPVAVQAIYFISSNLRQRLTLNDVARHCAVSTRCLSKVFHEQVNLTVNDYINLAKIDAAMWRLSDGRASISEVASILGFPSPQYFATVFKKYSGVTPREFRSRSHKDL